jgi:hypothetical protein
MDGEDFGALVATDSAPLGCLSQTVAADAPTQRTPGQKENPSTAWKTQPGCGEGLRLSPDYTNKTANASRSPPRGR